MGQNLIYQFDTYCKRVLQNKKLIITDRNSTIFFKKRLNFTAIIIIMAKQ